MWKAKTLFKLSISMDTWPEVMENDASDALGQQIPIDWQVGLRVQHTHDISH